MKQIVFITALALFLACSNSTSQVSSSPQSKNASDAIARMDREFGDNARAGNAQALVDGFYASDAVVMPPNAPALRGRDAIRQFWTGFLASASVDVTLTPDNVMPSCELATEIGHYDLTLTPKAADATSLHDHGKYVVTWKNADGRWRAVADIFNSDLPK